MRYEKSTELIGKRALNILEEFGRVAQLTMETVSGIARGKINLNLALEQMVKIGYESVPLAVTASAFVGMVFAVQIATEFEKFGAGKYVGGLMAIAMSRELGPALVG